MARETANPTQELSREERSREARRLLESAFKLLLHSDALKDSLMQSYLHGQTGKPIEVRFDDTIWTFSYDVIVPQPIGLNIASNVRPARAGQGLVEQKSRIVRQTQNHSDEGFVDFSGTFGTGTIWSRKISRGGHLSFKLNSLAAVANIERLFEDFSEDERNKQPLRPPIVLTPFPRP